MTRKPTRLDRVALSSNISHVSKNDIVEGKRIKYNVTRVTYSGRTHILKSHVSAYEDLHFPTELNAYCSHDLVSPHIISFIGHLMDTDDKIDGMLLEFGVNFDIRWYLHKFGPCNWNLKMKWAAQITHGLMEVHKLGMTHGDLRCENVVLDEGLDAKIIDIVQGTGFMPGWCPWQQHANESIHEPAWDIYSLGVTLWEIITDGGTPAENQNPHFEDLALNNVTGLEMANIAQSCLKEDPKDRPTADIVLAKLGGLIRCGCLAADGNTIPAIKQ